MKQSQFKSYDDLPLFLNAKWGPSGNVKHFRWERRSSGMTEPLPTGEGEGYGACDDEVAQVLGIALDRLSQDTARCKYKRGPRKMRSILWGEEAQRNE